MELSIVSGLKIAAWLLAVYVCVVLLVEVAIWRFQPGMDGEVRMSIPVADGTPIERTVFGLEVDGALYVSSNHWFRRWYHAAIDAEELELTFRGETRSARVVPVTGDERERISDLYRMGPWLRALCGFAPSRFLRLDQP